MSNIFFKPDISPSWRNGGFYVRLAIPSLPDAEIVEVRLEQIADDIFLYRLTWSNIVPRRIQQFRYVARVSDVHELLEDLGRHRLGYFLGGRMGHVYGAPT